MSEKEHKHKDDKDWKISFFARDKKNIMYRAYKSDATKELYYEHPTKPLIYGKEGKLIGYKGKDNKPHFHEPSGGWGVNKKELEKIKNVGPIVNKYLGVLKTGPLSKGKESEMYKLGAYQDAKSTMSNIGNQEIRRTEDLIFNELKKIEKDSF